MLTDTQCLSARPKKKLYRLNDFNGLYLEVKPNGKKAWRYRFKLNGKPSMFALGEYPVVKLARNASKQVADGVSPTQARLLDKIARSMMHPTPLSNSQRGVADERLGRNHQNAATGYA